MGGRNRVRVGEEWWRRAAGGYVSKRAGAPCARCLLRRSKKDEENWMAPIGHMGNLRVRRPRLQLMRKLTRMSLCPSGQHRHTSRHDPLGPPPGRLMPGDDHDRRTSTARA